MGALLVYLTVFHGQHDLSVLGHHAKEGGNPHPEHRAGTADKDGAGNAGNVASAHRTGQSGRYRLEGGEVMLAAALFLILGKQGADGVAQDEPKAPGLQPPGAEGEVDAGANQ